MIYPANEMMDKKVFHSSLFLQLNFKSSFEVYVLVQDTPETMLLAWSVLYNQCAVVLKDKCNLNKA